MTNGRTWVKTDQRVCRATRAAADDRRAPCGPSAVQRGGGAPRRGLRQGGRPRRSDGRPAPTVQAAGVQNEVRYQQPSHAPHHPPASRPAGRRAKRGLPQARTSSRSPDSYWSCWYPWSAWGPSYGWSGPVAWFESAVWFESSAWAASCVRWCPWWAAGCSEALTASPGLSTWWRCKRPRAPPWWRGAGVWVPWDGGPAPSCAAAPSCGPAPPASRLPCSRPGRPRRWSSWSVIGRRRRTPPRPRPARPRWRSVILISSRGSPFGKIRRSAYRTSQWRQTVAAAAGAIPWRGVALRATPAHEPLVPAGRAGKVSPPTEVSDKPSPASGRRSSSTQFGRLRGTPKTMADANRR
jgi:hypothetical protein